MSAKYYIYRNLRKGGFSIRYRGKVIDVVDELTAYNVKFQVSEKGRQRAIKNGSRNVHAFVIAEYYELSVAHPGRLKEVYYNPFVVDSFVAGDDKIYEADRVFMFDGKAYIND